MTNKKKLIEVALPLASINIAAASEGSVGQRPHPKNIHRWWARRPLAAARAVIWASLVDDPSCNTETSAEEQHTERLRLFEILEALILWDNNNNTSVIERARQEIDRCYPDGPPPVVDPFGGGGAIAIEAQRLGLVAISSDLNPIAVMIQRAALEIPHKFTNQAPVFPTLRSERIDWHSTEGLAADIYEYGKWMQQEVFARIGHHFPNVVDRVGTELTPMAWIWARTIESPDPSWSGKVPLVTSWTLSAKSGKPKVWIEPVVSTETFQIEFKIRTGGEPNTEKSFSNGEGRCIATGSAITRQEIKSAGMAGKLGVSLMATVAGSSSGKVFVEPSEVQAEAALIDSSEFSKVSSLKGDLSDNRRDIKPPTYGFESWSDLFTDRQRLALETFCEVLKLAGERSYQDAIAAGRPDDQKRLSEGGLGARAYSDAIVTFLAFTISKLADWSSQMCGWNSANAQIRNVFALQAIPMTWDFAEVNPFSGKMASWDSQLDGVVKSVRDCLGHGLQGLARVEQLDARASVRSNPNSLISTDPPYYDNISYADISDFFYVILRRCLSDVWPNEFATLATPKADELIAQQYRAGSRSGAQAFFEEGMSDFMKTVYDCQTESAPATIYYAYKATESSGGRVTSTGWDTFLQAVVDAGLTVTATWPLRTERQGRMIAVGANALASSIVLACRRRPSSAGLATRSEFVNALRAELPEAVGLLQSGNIAPVDIPQSTIGPGIGVFSRFARVVESDGSTMRVSVALSIINDVLSEILDGEESEMDADSRFALTWYSQFGFDSAASGDADGMARAKNTSVAGVVDAGVGETRAGKFRLYRRSELSPGWSPLTDKRPTVWEAAQHLIAALERSESEAAELLRQLGGYAERARVLAYLLFKKATDRGWAEEAGAYNGLIVAWSALQSASVPTTQQSMELG